MIEREGGGKANGVVNQKEVEDSKNGVWRGGLWR